VVLDPSCFQSKCYSVGYLVVPSLPIVISLERKMNENVQNSTPFTGNIILLLYLRVKIPSSFKVISTLTKTSLKFYSDFRHYISKSWCLFASYTSPGVCVSLCLPQGDIVSKGAGRIKLVFSVWGFLRPIMHHAVTKFRYLWTWNISSRHAHRSMLSTELDACGRSLWSNSVVDQTKLTILVSADVRSTSLTMQFITLSVHQCMQHDAWQAARRDGLSAVAGVVRDVSALF